MFTRKERVVFLVLALVCFAIGSSIASYAVSGTLTWGWDARAWYQSYIGEREIGTPFSGQRVISTNNGMLALCFTPFLVTAFLLLFAASFNKNIPGLVWASAWLAAGLGFPVYAILFVNILYDSMGVTGAANPWVVSGMVIVITVVLGIIGSFEKDSPNKL